MNKRQIKKRVKRAKINKERGMILSLEDLDKVIMAETGVTLTRKREGKQ